WSYPSSTGSSTLIQHLFYRPTFGGPRRLWMPGDMGILEASMTSNVARGFSSAPLDLACQASGNAGSCQCNIARIPNVIAGRGPGEVAVLGTAPKVPVEGLGALWERIGSASATDPNAKKIGVQNTADAGGAGPPPPPPRPKPGGEPAGKPGAGPGRTKRPPATHDGRD